MAGRWLQGGQPDGRAVTARDGMLAQSAAYKVLVDKRLDRILSAHLLGTAAEETINLFALAMRCKLTATDLKSTLFAFPTFGSEVRKMV